MTDPVKQSGFERHAQTILAMVIASILIYVGFTTTETAKKLEGMQAQLAAIATDRYTLTQAKADFEVRDLKQTYLQMDVKSLDNRLNKIEHNIP